MDNGVTYIVENETDGYVKVLEHIDLTHPDCPVVCLNKDVRWAVIGTKMTREELAEKYPMLATK